MFTIITLFANNCRLAFCGILMVKYYVFNFFCSISLNLFDYKIKRINEVPSLYNTGKYVIIFSIHYAKTKATIFN